KPSAIPPGWSNDATGTTQRDGTSLIDKLTEPSLPLIGVSWQKLQHPSVSITISGTISYCAAASATGSANTTVNLTGDAASSTSTGAPPSTGDYSFSNLALGSYVVTPTKTGAVSGISSLDAARVQQHILGPPNPQLTACQQLAGDVNQSGSLSSLDCAFIQQFVINVMPVNPANHTGEWRFNPANRTYVSITSDQANQNFDAMLLGDANGTWTPAGPIGQLSSVIGERLSEPRAGRASVGQSKGSSVHTQAQFSQTVSLPNAVVGTNLTNFTLPLTLSANTAPFISFDLHFTFNTAVVGFQATPVSAAGLTASGWSVAGNVVGNELRISGFATTATP